MTTHQTTARHLRKFIANWRASSLAGAIFLLVLAAVGFGISRYLQPAESPAVPAETLQMPVANPPLEPDRPDLIGEPRPGVRPGV